MKPGRRPKSDDEFGRTRGIDLGWLKSQAYVWNMVLHRVRDGHPGFIAKITSRGPRKPKLERVMDYLAFFDLLSESERQRRGVALPQDRKVDLVIVSAVAPRRFDDARKFISGKKGYVLTPPEPPRPELWKRITETRSVEEVRRIARALHLSHHLSVPQWQALHFHAEDVLRAKQLQNYPRTKRGGSDEKRMHFFSKVLSGLMQGQGTPAKVRLRISGRRTTICFYPNEGIAPATATKRLARLPLPKKEYFERFWEDQAAWHSKPKFRKRPMTRLVQYERQAATGEGLAVYEDQTGQIWREKMSDQSSIPRKRSNDHGPL